MYELRVLQRLWYHASTLILVVLIGNWLIFGVATSSSSIIEGIFNYSGPKWEVIFFALACTIGPLINLLVWALVAHFIYDAFDDLERQDFIGSVKRRHRIACIVKALVGALLLPPLMFPYTFHLPNLWGNEPAYWSSNGWFGFTALGAFLGYLAALRGYKGENVIDEMFKDIET